MMSLITGFQIFIRTKVFSSVSSAIKIGWNLLAKAKSRSIVFVFGGCGGGNQSYLSLRQRGLSIFARSSAPLALPAPTIVDFINKKYYLFVFGFFQYIFYARFKIASKHGAGDNFTGVKIKYFLSRKNGVISPLAIFWAMPWIMAVFPTPASPISRGLFFVFLNRAFIVL